MSDAQLAAFNELATALCPSDDAEGVKPREDAFGVVSYHFLTDETEVALAYLPGPGQTHFNVLIDAGAAPLLADAEAWAALMALDFAMVSSCHDACFCCDEPRSRLQLRMVFRLGDTDAPRLATAITEGVKAVRIWHESSSELSVVHSLDGVSYAGARP